MLALHLGSEVREGDTRAADQSALRTIDRDTAAIPVAIANTVSFPGAEVTVGGIGLALAVGFLLRRRVLDALFVAGTVGGYAVLTLVGKGLVQRQRPVAFFRVPESGYSFPSGHTTASTATYLLLAVILTRLEMRRSARIAAFCLAALIALATGVSRVYLGVHWPSDVLAGWMLGGAWALLAALVTRPGADRSVRSRDSH